MAGLRELWGEPIPGAGDLADQLVRRYGGQRTAYRDEYLIAVLDALDSLEQLATDPVAVRLAAWFHRAAHSANNTPTEDAAASAQLAEELLPKYGVSEVRTAEVARLVRSTGGEGANGAVLQDAVNAVLADPRYATYASELRRDSRFDVGVRREQIRTMLASERIYRTDLAHEHYEQAARANLTAELQLLDALTPHPWRGWQRTGLAVLAVLTAFVAFVAGAASAGQPWQLPAFKGDPKWQAVLMAVLAAAAVVALWWAVRRTDNRKTRVVVAVPAVIGLAGVVIILLNVPKTTGASGVGQRVPLLMITSVLLILASAAAFAATRFKAGITRNRGQVLAGLGAVAVVVLATLLVIDPIQRAYLFSANEYVDNKHQPADVGVTSVVNGERLWTHPGRLDFGTVVGTAGGIAVSAGRGTVEMLDPGTGVTRWRYIRADTDELPRLYALNAGHQVLVSYDDLGHVVLDAETGKRTASWPDSTRDNDIDDNDPLLTARSVSKGSDKLYGTNTDGSNRWTYEPGRCTGISATAAAQTVVVGLDHSCGDSDELVGLDLRTGKKLWTHTASLSDLTPVGGLVVGIESGSLVGVDPRSGDTKWRSEIPADWTCPVRIEASGDRVVLDSCPSTTQNRTDSVVRVIDAGTGRVVSTTSVQVAFGRPYAVTANGVVVLAGSYDADLCRVATVDEGAVGYYRLGDSVTCGTGAMAAGNLILVGTGDGLIALR